MSEAEVNTKIADIDEFYQSRIEKFTKINEATYKIQVDIEKVLNPEKAIFKFAKKPEEVKPGVLSRIFNVKNWGSSTRKFAGATLGVGVATVSTSMLWMQKADAAYVADVNTEALEKTGLEEGETTVEVPQGSEFSSIVTLKREDGSSVVGVMQAPGDELMGRMASELILPTPTE